MPVDLAEHHVAGEDHHLGGGLPLVGDRQAVAGFVQAEALDQSRLIEVAAVRDAGVQTIAHEIVHLVDVDRPREHAPQQPAAAVGGLVGEHLDHVARLDVPLVAQHVGEFPFEQKAVGEQLVAGDLPEADVFDRMAERPVAEVVEQRGRRGTARPPRAGRPLRSGRRRRGDRDRAAPSGRRRANARTACGSPRDRRGSRGRVG